MPRGSKLGTGELDCGQSLVDISLIRKLIGKIYAYVCKILGREDDSLLCVCFGFFGATV